MKYYLPTLSISCIFIILGLFSCNQQAQAPKNLSELLTAHKWQLTFEEGLNLPSESLRDNIIELAPSGELIYYEDKEKVNLFTKNRWEISKDGQKIIEILPDGSRIESKIIEVSDKVLKLTYEEPDGLGGIIKVIERYEKFTPQPVASLP